MRKDVLNMKRKIMSGTALMLIVLMTCICAFASSYTTYIVRDGKAVLTASENMGEYIDVPGVFEDTVVSGIGTEAFKGSELKGIKLSENISYIEWGAFEDCRNLEGIDIPDNVTMIEDMTFSGCTSLKTVAFPKNLQFIGVKAFSNTDLEEIVIPADVKAIDIKAFENCSNLVYAEIPEGVEYIADTAFEGCNRLTVKCVKGTYAEKYMIENNISYVAE